MKKKLLALFLMVVMVLAAVVGLVACDPGNNPDNPDTPKPGSKKNIVVWVSETEGIKTLTETQIAAFMDAHPDYKDKYTVTVEGVSESESATKMVTDVATGADIYCFAQDQLGRLIEAQALAKLGEAAKKFVSDNNDAGSVRAASIGSDTYCYPITSDNGYFMYYDKSVITNAEHLNDLAALVADCEGASKKFAFELEGSAWYTASFFFGAGCTSSWTMNAQTKKWKVNDDFDTDKGIIALKGMQILTKSAAYVNSSKAVEFGGAWKDDDGNDHEGGAAIVVSGTWDYAKAKELLKDNFGVAKLPSYTVGDKTYQLGSYSGYKLMGVKPHTDPAESKFCHDLAQHLSGKDAQKARFDEKGWGPSNKECQAMDDVKANEALIALSAQNAFAVPQGNIHGGWWDFAKLLGKVSREAALNDETALQAGLTSYRESLNKYENMTEEEMKAFTIIGSIASIAEQNDEDIVNGPFGSWGGDYKMVEGPDGTWTTAKAIVLAEGDQFKIRQGQSWTVAYGSCDNKGHDEGNYVVDADHAGSYKIQLVVDKDGNGTITLIAAE